MLIGLYLCFAFAFILFTAVGSVDNAACEKLLPGQYLCREPVIDENTQLPVCYHGFTNVSCDVAAGIQCNFLLNGTFIKQIFCEESSGKDYQTAVILSIFLGWLGVDRFYLGYPAIGLFKLCTLGFFFVFHLADIILIALQVVGPADQRPYYVSYYGPNASRITYNDHTFINSGHS